MHLLSGCTQVKLYLVNTLGNLKKNAFGVEVSGYLNSEYLTLHCNPSVKLKKVIEVLMPSLNPVSDRDTSTTTQSQSSEVIISGVAGQKRPPPGDRYLPFPKRPAPLFASTSTSSTQSHFPEGTVSFDCLYSEY